jgi:hypothetical protein
MIIQHPSKPGGYRIEEELYKNLIVLPKRIEKDKDVVGLFVGSPGEGKSTLAQQCLYPLDKSISVENIKWSYEDYVGFCIKLFEKGKSKGKGAIHDESRESLASITSTSKRTRLFMNFLYENRQMNMYQFLLTGDFFSLPKSIVMQRTMFLIWVHEEGEFENGYFKFYNRHDLKRLYIKGKKENNMAASSYTFRGTFPKFYTVDEEEYRKIKKSSMTIDRYVAQKKGREFTIKEILFWIWDRSENVSPIDAVRLLNIDHSMYFKCRKQWKVDNGLDII